MEMSNISCDDFTVDGILNGDVTDGQFSLTLTQQDYDDGLETPGGYQIKFKGTVIGSDPEQTVTDMFDILVSDPNCEDLDLFEVTAQDIIPNDNYSGATFEWTLNRFSVEPANPCADDIIYSC